MTPAAELTRSFLDALLDLRLELSLLNHRIAKEVGLNASDLDCLEVLSRRGPTSPARLARRLGIHPATMTGILARLEDSGWVERTPDPNDGRASEIRMAVKADVRLRRRYASATQAVIEGVATRSDTEVAVLVEVLKDLAARAQSVK